MRNRYPGTCYVCGLQVSAGTGHFERHLGSWRVKHGVFSGQGRVTCEDARAATAKAEGRSAAWAAPQWPH